MHVVSGQIRKAPLIKQLQDSTMFVVELAEVVKDYKTGEKTYTNYKAMLFAKSAAAIDYYTQATAEGSFIVLTSEKLKIETFDAQSGKTYITLMMDNARLENAQFSSSPAPQQQAAPAPQYQAQPQMTPQHQPQAAPATQAQAPQSWGTPPTQGQQQAQPAFNDDLPPF